MEFNYFIGCDVSKNELDFAVMKGKEFLFHQEIENTPSAVKYFIDGLLKKEGFNIKDAVICLEHTGIYNNHLLCYLHKKQANICLEVASQIKNSMGNVRGKNDKVDAIRIAEYAYKNRDGLRLWTPKREIVTELSHLAALRSRLINAKKQLSMPLEESSSFVSKKILNQNKLLCNKALKGIEDDLKSVEETMEKVIKMDEELKRLFSIITSVKGVGKITATQIIITTNEFKDIKNPKKFACYAGVAPFVRESGLMKGKGRVSHLANKKVKTVLHMSALVAINHNSDLKKYYERKVKEEKKNKMLVINAVRNKLILIIFACVNQNRKYEEEYIRAVA